MKAQGVPGAMQSRCPGTHHCSSSIPQLSATVGPGHRNSRVPPVQVWGSRRQEHATMLQPLPQSIVCCFSHPDPLFMAAGFLMYVTWPKLQNYTRFYSSIMENTIHHIVEQGGL